MNSNLLFSFGRMCPDCSLPTLEEISHASFAGWPTSGITERGECLTLNSSECPNEDDGYSAYSLADVLEPSVAPKYFLSPLACRGIIRRAAKRGKALPTQLGAALQAVASRHPEEAEKTIATSSLPQQSERLASARKGRATREAKTA